MVEGEKISQNSWKKGWYPDHHTLHQAPRWEFLPGSRHTGKSAAKLDIGPNATIDVGGGFRSTWVEKHVSKQQTPGPGHYKTPTGITGEEWDKSEFVDTTHSVYGSSPSWTQSKCKREVLLKKERLSPVKPSYMAVRVGKGNQLKASPGPGQYTQYTMFGGASGPTRKEYFTDHK